MSGWRAHVDRQPWAGQTRLFLTRDGARGERGVVLPLQMQALQDGIPYDMATLSQTREDERDAIGDVDGFLQAMLDAAWAEGMRPRSFSDHTNELTAVRYHLEDMRALAKVPPRA